MPPDPPESRSTSDLEAYAVFAINNLATDMVAREVVEASMSAGIQCLLLKGPVIERWLFDGKPVRQYADVDLLVSPADFELARGVMERLDFEIWIDDCDTPGQLAPAHHWCRRRDNANVDLHRWIWGVAGNRQEAWDIIAAQAETMSIGGLDLAVPGESFRALHLALHALQHSIDPRSHARSTLRVGLQRIGPSVWVEAAEMANLIGAGPAFAAGLKLESEGQAIAEGLSLDEKLPPELERLVAGAPPGSHSLDALLSRSQPADRARQVIRKLFPTRRFMRVWSPLARRSSVGMALAYVGRPFSVSWRTLAVIRWRLIHAWRRT